MKAAKPWTLRNMYEWSGAGEMAQRLRALAALPEVLGSIPGTHLVAHNKLQTPVPGDLMYSLSP